ncbi:MAG: alpha-amylase family glycosyl hydrolase [Gaiellaceae bacterium]
MGGVIYQIYPRSFADSNGDGVGDLPGISAHLDHLDWLGVDAIWSSPTFPSPNADWGYDVADYGGVHPDLGTLDDLDRLIAQARGKDIELWLDLVPNHTSNQHAWFQEHPEYYVWAKGLPNDWKSVFTKRSAWRLDERFDRRYLHQFTPEQPDLDWWADGVRDEFDRILRFWFDRGIRGFRIDVAHALIKDKLLRDGVQYLRERPEVHEIYARWQEIAAEYDPKPTLMGETYVTLDKLTAYYQHLDLAQNFDFCGADFTLDELRPIVERTLREIPGNREPIWFGSNHDHSRMATRWGKGDERRIRAALFLVLTLPGWGILYQGDELGLEDGKVPRNRIADPAKPPRDPERTPLPWTRSGAEWRDPWLPLTDTSRNVADQMADPDSTLHYTRRLVERRKDFADESYETLPSVAGVWAYRRGLHTCVLNMTDQPREHEGTALAPWEAAILQTV